MHVSLNNVLESRIPRPSRSCQNYDREERSSYPGRPPLMKHNACSGTPVNIEYIVHYSVVAGRVEAVFYDLLQEEARFTLQPDDETKI